MKKLWSLVIGIFLAGLVGGPVMAANTAGQASPQTQGAPQAGQNVPQPDTGKVTRVSKVQQDIMKKREEARQRRDRMLKVRAQTIKAGIAQDKASAK